MRYLLSLILVIGFSSVSYANTLEGEIICDITGITRTEFTDYLNITNNIKDLQEKELTSTYSLKKDYWDIKNTDKFAIRWTNKIMTFQFYDNKGFLKKGGNIFKIDKFFPDFLALKDYGIYYGHESLIIDGRYQKGFIAKHGVELRNEKKTLRLNKVGNTDNSPWYGYIIYEMPNEINYFITDNNIEPMPSYIDTIGLYCKDTGSLYPFLLHYK